MNIILVSIATNIDRSPAERMNKSVNATDWMIDARDVNTTKILGVQQSKCVRRGRKLDESLIARRKRNHSRHVKSSSKLVE